MSTTNERARAAAEEIAIDVPEFASRFEEIIARHFAYQDASDTLRTLATNACDLWADEKDHFSDKFYSAMKALNDRLDATPVEPVAATSDVIAKARDVVNARKDYWDNFITDGWRVSTRKNDAITAAIKSLSAALYRLDAAKEKP